MIYPKFDPMGISRAQKQKMKPPKISYFRHFVHGRKLPDDMIKSFSFLTNKVKNMHMAPVCAVHVVAWLVLVYCLGSFIKCFITQGEKSNNWVSNQTTGYQIKFKSRNLLKQDSVSFQALNDNAIYFTYLVSISITLFVTYIFDWDFFKHQRIFLYFYPIGHQ